MYGPERPQFFTVGVADWLGSGWLIGSAEARVRPRAASVFHGWGGRMAPDWFVYGPERPQFSTVGVAVWFGYGFERRLFSQVGGGGPGSGGESGKRHVAASSG